jgi:hypothetical protein
MSLMSWLIWSSSLATGSGVGGADGAVAGVDEAAGAEPVASLLPDSFAPDGPPAAAL